jgi:hypothetical protein
MINEEVVEVISHRDTVMEEEEETQPKMKMTRD